MEFLIAGRSVSAGHLSIVVDLPQVSVSRSGEVNGTEHPAAEQKSMVFALQLIGVITDDVAISVNANGSGLGCARRRNWGVGAVVEHKTPHILDATGVGETVRTYNVAASANTQGRGVNRAWKIDRREVAGTEQKATVQPGSVDVSSHNL